MKTPFMSKALWSEPASHPLMSISGAGFRGKGETTQPAWLYHKSCSSRPLQPITCKKQAEILLPPQTSMLLQEGRGKSMENRDGSSLGGLSNEKEEL